MITDVSGFGEVEVYIQYENLLSLENINYLTGPMARDKRPSLTVCCTFIPKVARIGGMHDVINALTDSQVEHLHRHISTYAKEVKNIVEGNGHKNKLILNSKIC